MKHYIVTLILYDVAKPTSDSDSTQKIGLVKYSLGLYHVCRLICNVVHGASSEVEVKKWQQLGNYRYRSKHLYLINVILLE